LNPDVLSLIFHGIPILPVKVWHDEKWKKEPLVSWDEATIDETQIERWWLRWPEALPGIPLRKVDWVVIDVDDPENATAFWEVWNNLGPRGPYSKVQTPSGGWHFVYSQHPQHPVRKFQWCDGVEILGSSCLIAIYNVEEILSAAPRAWLPKPFWEPCPRPTGDPSTYRKKIEPKGTGAPDVTAVATLTEALFKLNACEWRKRHDDWLLLAMACKAVGITCRDFVRWNTSDPHYAADERDIERKWDSFEGKHGGALFKALAEHGIKVGHTDSGKLSVCAGVSHEAKASAPAKSGDLRDHSRHLIDWLNSAPTEDRLFYVACVFAERGMDQHVALALLKSSPLRKSLGVAEFGRTIGNAFRHIQLKETA
jgi:hypothetical protein